MSRIPTDLEIAEELYDRYYNSFRKYAKDEPDRIARIRVPINVREVADAIGVEEDMIFGRIFYHFNKKYSYTDDKGNITTFFITDKFEGLSVNFPLVASVLADLREDRKKTEQFMFISLGAFIFSMIALIVTLLF